MYTLLHNNDSSKGYTDYLVYQSIDWKFINSRSPHEGMWESGAKCVKQHLRRILANASFVFEDFYTVIVKIEAVLSSRPVSYLSSDPNHTTPLTPGNFLIGRLLTMLPDSSVMDIKQNRISSYQRARQLMEHFWRH